VDTALVRQELDVDARILSVKRMHVDKTTESFLHVDKSFEFSSTDSSLCQCVSTYNVDPK